MIFLEFLLRFLDLDNKMNRNVYLTNLIKINLESNSFNTRYFVRW